MIEVLVGQRLAMVIGTPPSAKPPFMVEYGAGKR
jgi:hypothetical protein